jgi:small-conductance mechanosensitive channel
MVLINGVNYIDSDLGLNIYYKSKFFPDSIYDVTFDKFHLRNGLFLDQEGKWVPFEGSVHEIAIRAEISRVLGIDVPEFEDNLIYYIIFAIAFSYFF